GIETALGILLELVEAGLLTLERAIDALTDGPARVLDVQVGARRRGGIAEGDGADLVVFDRSDRWTVGPESMVTRGFGHPLAGMSLPGRVLVTVAGGRLAYEDAAAG